MVGQSLYPADLLYHPEHDWARVEGESATFGITAFAQAQLGEIVFWDRPSVGATVEAGKPHTELESVKAVSDVIAPMSGEIVEVNAALSESPDLINRSPYGDGWLVHVRLSSPEQVTPLLSAAAYAELIA